MATISSLGSGSGLDLQSLLNGLMQAEQQPLFALRSKEASYQSRISALGSLKGVLSSLQTAASAMVPSTGTTAAAKYITTSYSASVADSSIASATASSSAVAGSYSLEVTQLAQQHRIMTSTPGDGGITPFSGTDETLTTGGTLTIRLDTQAGSVTPTKTTDITIADGATPETIRDAINSASAGVSATVVNGTNGKQLVLVGDSPGSNQFIKLSGVAALAYDPIAVADPLTDPFAQTQTAQGAAFKLGGIAATATSNTVSTAIDGLTLTLAKTNIGTPTTLTVSKTTSNSLSSSLNAFITAYNAANKSVAELGAYNAETKEAGSLQGDTTLRTAKNQIRSLVFSATAGGTSAYQHLSDIGVSLGKDGSLSLNSSKLTAAVAADPTAVANLVAAVGSAYKAGVEGLVGTSGSITSATDGANRSIKDITKRQAAIAARLTSIEASYTRQFSSLDSLIAGMKQTSSYLTQQLASLPGVTSNN